MLNILKLLFQNKYFKYIFLIINILIIFVLLYMLGYCEGKNKVLQQYKQLELKLKNDYIKELILKQKSINDLTYSLSKINQENKNKYENLSQELSKTNSNLDKCKLDNNSLHIIISSTKQLPSNSTSKSNNDATPSKRNTDNNRVQELNCRDLSQSYLVSNKMYFECKNIVDAWQSWYYINFPQDKK